MLTAELVSRLWAAFHDHDWVAARAVLADDFGCDWPQTGERFAGAEGFIAMNRAHPAPHWRIDGIEVLQATDGRAAARVIVLTDESVEVCLGCCSSGAGLLTTAVEYWTEHRRQPTPNGRARWSTPMPGLRNS